MISSCIESVFWMVLRVRRGQNLFFFFFFFSRSSDLSKNALIVIDQMGLAVRKRNF